ncbi:MAG: hypothetical protein HHAS10_08920 [Candidatus Altimarinota bacterium]
MFIIPVGDLLSSYSGDSRSFSFSGEVFDGALDDIKFTSPLEFTIEIVALDDAVEVIFKNLATTILYEEKKYSISIGNFERTFKNYIDPLDPDDIRPIENTLIDLGPVLREEIIMATYSHS